MNRAVFVPGTHYRQGQAVCWIGSWLLLLALLLPLLAFSPVRAQVPPADVGPLLGFYSPNTTIELRGDQLWFVRPPFETRLLPGPDATYIAERGWIAGKSLQFVPNEAGGISIQIRQDDGAWYEFARSGEVYTDLDPALIDRLEAILEQTVAYRNTPGVAVYVHIPGKGMWMGARGLANVELGIPLVPHDRFRIASVTKTFVATVVLQLAQEGTLSLDDSVERWLPRLLPNGDQITIRQLLNHTSGLYDYLNDPAFDETVFRDPHRVWYPAELVRYAVQRGTYFAPGAGWFYSNTNYIVLGMIVERVSGQSLASNIRSRMLNPLKLKHTFFESAEPMPAGIVHGYVGQYDYTDVDMSFAWAAGGMVSTTEDLGRFADALFSGQLLDPAHTQALLDFRSVNGAWGAPYLSYGLGVMQDIMSISGARQGRPDRDALGTVQGHTGGLVGYRSVMWYLPATGITVVVLHNRMGVDPNIIATDVMDAVLSF